MLDKATLKKFISKANQWREQFCVRKYANNCFHDHQTTWNEQAKDGLYKTDDEAIKNSCKYTNFWSIVLPSLQHGWILSVARLLDHASFGKNKKNLSIDYIIEWLKDENLKQDMKDMLCRQEEFITSVKTLRNTFLAHNDIWVNDNKMISGGVEFFFEDLDTMIKKIKAQDQALQDCNNLNLEFTEKLSETWLKEIFEKIA